MGLGDQAPPTARRIDRRITPGVRRVLDRLRDVPVVVVDPAWHVIEMNELGRELHGDDDRNIMRRHFAGEPTRVVRTPAEVARMEEGAVADLHARLRRAHGRRQRPAADRLQRRARL